MRRALTSYLSTPLWCFVLLVIFLCSLVFTDHNRTGWSKLADRCRSMVRSLINTAHRCTYSCVAQTVPFLRRPAPNNWLHSFMLHWMWRAGSMLQMSVWQSGSDQYWILFRCFCKLNCKPRHCKVLFCPFSNCVCICDVALCTFSARLSRKRSAKLYKLQENTECKGVPRCLMWSTHILQTRSLRLSIYHGTSYFIYYRVPQSPRC